jgi:hypothetical protein
VSETLHILGLPHTMTNGEYATCAYTEKIRKFCDMMTGGERQVILYAGAENTAACDEHVVCVTADQREAWFGPHDLGSLERGGFDWNPNSPWWTHMNTQAISEIKERAQPTDLLLLSAGQAQQIVADTLGSMIVAEFGVGYEGIITHRQGPSPAFAAFESHSHRHLVYGLNRWQNTPRAYDTVIPNYFNPDELPYGEGGDYLLFVGRLIQLKGVSTAARVAEALDMKLVVAGPGATEWGDGFVVFPEGEARASGLEYVGAVNADERSRLMGSAAVTLMPTSYVEPFGGVAVESMMCGTPVVTTDFGAFTETVEEGVSGFRFQTLQEAVDATALAMQLDRADVHSYAVGRYSLDAVEPLYDRWFDNLDGLWGEGWTALRSRERMMSNG